MRAFSVVTLFAWASTAQFTTDAIWGATGFGARAKGGRGEAVRGKPYYSGECYVVTNLKDSGPGSLREAVSRSDRLVAFTVGGLLKITDAIKVAPRVTVLGSTSPGGQITVYGNGLDLTGADDSAIAYLRIRPGKDSKGASAVTITSGKNIILDHLSIAWAKGDAIRIAGPEVANITIQTSFIGQGLGPNATSGVIETAIGNGVTVYRNLFIDNKGGLKVQGSVEFLWNTIYNWGDSAYVATGGSRTKSEINLIGNYFIAGPGSSGRPFQSGAHAEYRAFVDHNYLDDNKDGVLNASPILRDTVSYGRINVQGSKYRYPDPGNGQYPSTDPVLTVGMNSGTNILKDDVDKRLIAELRSWGKSGQFLDSEFDDPVNGPGDIKEVTEEDLDGDGIPDRSENIVGATKGVNDAMQSANEAPTIIEEWALMLMRFYHRWD